MKGMTTPVDPSSASARESARRSDGTFGTQPLTETDMDLAQTAPATSMLARPGDLGAFRHDLHVPDNPDAVLALKKALVLAASKAKALGRCRTDTQPCQAVAART